MLGLVSVTRSRDALRWPQKTLGKKEEKSFLSFCLRISQQPWLHRAWPDSRDVGVAPAPSAENAGTRGYPGSVTGTSSWAEDTGTQGMP